MHRSYGRPAASDSLVFYDPESSPVLHGKLSDHTCSVPEMCLWTLATIPPWCRFGYAGLRVTPSGAGVTIHLGRTGDRICPVLAMLDYLVRRGMSPGPFFLFQDGSSLSRHRLIQHVHHALSQHGLDDTGVSGHSFCIGAATAVA